MAKINQSRAIQAQVAEGHAVALVEYFECLPPETSNRNLLINSAWQMLEAIYNEWNLAEADKKESDSIEVLDISSTLGYEIRLATIDPRA